MHLRQIILPVLFILSVLYPAFGQHECQALHTYPDGSYLVKIDNRQYRALSEEQMQRLLKMEVELKAFKEKYQLADSLLKTYEKAVVQYDTTLNRHKRYVAELEDIHQGYKDLLADYKKLYNPALSLELGAGMTGSFEPALMTGLRYNYVHLWGFLQRQNSGILIGTHFNLF
jgi:hypothetical protein